MFVRERDSNASVPSRRPTLFSILRSHLSYAIGRGRDSQRDSLSLHGNPILVARLSGSHSEYPVPTRTPRTRSTNCWTNHGRREDEPNLEHAPFSVQPAPQSRKRMHY